MLTRAATEFVGPRHLRGAHRPSRAHGAVRRRARARPHQARAAQRELVVVAPATADFMARAATGQADDLLTACLLATEAPVLLVPAMNDRMWAHAQTQANAAHLRAARLPRARPGRRACSPRARAAARGACPSPRRSSRTVGRLLEGAAAPLAGRRVLVTAGPTREPIDPVRFLSNHSSGRMGVAIAAAAWRRGADVTLIAGPLAVPVPVGVRHVHGGDDAADASTRSSASLAGCRRAGHGGGARGLPARRPWPTHKIKKIAATRARSRSPRTPTSSRARGPRGGRARWSSGFALETDDVLANARRKLDREGARPDRR